MEIEKHCFTLEAVDSIKLPEYKGSTFHGGFGRALNKISPTWYDFFYNQRKDTPSLTLNPYVILPPLDLNTEYSSGDVFQVSLTLFGEATQHYAICHAAIEFLGLQCGLGYDKGKFKVVDIQTSKPALKAAPDKLTKITLQSPTRLRLKHHNRLVRKPPDFSILITSIMRRANSLYAQYGKCPTDLPSEDTLLQLAKHIKMTEHTLKWDDWDRFSGEQKKWMKFGGLVGDITYQGDLAPFYELLQLGEWIYIGGKTSFGLGKYKMEMSNG